MEQHMVERFATALRRVDEHAEILPRGLLADELIETFRAKGRIGVFAGALGRSDSGRVRGH
jgi:hypothetical protein